MPPATVQSPPSTNSVLSAVTLVTCTVAVVELFVTISGNGVLVCPTISLGISGASKYHVGGISTGSSGCSGFGLTAALRSVNVLLRCARGGTVPAVAGALCATPAPAAACAVGEAPARPGPPATTTKIAIPMKKMGHNFRISELLKGGSCCGGGERSEILLSARPRVKRFFSHANARPVNPVVNHLPLH